VESARLAGAGGGYGAEVTISFKDLCFDAADPVAVGTFWATALGHEVEVFDDGDTAVSGPHFPKIWVDAVPEPKVIKNRVHLDLRVPDVDALVDLGATVLAEHERWTVLADPEGNELCAFGDPEGEALAVGAPAKVFALCVDSDHPEELAAWWQARLGGILVPGSDGALRWIDDARGLEGLTFKCVRVADERVAKNRSHWDVTAVGADPRSEADQVAELVDAGATVLRPHDAEIRWTVLADPQGNEFCLFADGPTDAE
jgi:hypothetical protein